MPVLDATVTSMLDPDKFMARRKPCDCGDHERQRIIVRPPQGHGEMWNGSARAARAARVAR